MRPSCKELLKAHERTAPFARQYATQPIPGASTSPEIAQKIITFLSQRSAPKNIHGLKLPEVGHHLVQKQQQARTNAFGEEGPAFNVEGFPSLAFFRRAFPYLYGQVGKGGLLLRQDAGPTPTLSASELAILYAYLTAKITPDNMVEVPWDATVAAGAKHLLGGVGLDTLPDTTYDPAIGGLTPPP